MRRDTQDAEFTEFVQGRWRSLYRTAYLLVGDHALAEDLVQTALAKTYASWTRIRVREAADAYARRTLVTTAMSWWRRRSWQQERPYDQVPDQAEQGPADALTQRQWVWCEVQRLPPRQRAVVVLRFYEDLTEKQIAETMNCSVGTVKSQAHDALATLRESLGDEILPVLVEES